MRDKTLRAIGATVVLVGIAVVASAQIDLTGDPDAISLGPEEQGNDTGIGAVSGGEPSSIPESIDPFVYRVGVLSGISTDNFWAFYGGDASVWNAYVLGPTKPALYVLDPVDSSIEPELAAALVTPVQDDSGWGVQVPISDSLRWSDGSPITAHDVVFTFDTVRRLELGGSWAEAFPASIASLHADSDVELSIRFSERPNLALWPHGSGLAPIMSARVWGPQIEGLEAGELYALSGQGDVGGGPLALESVEDGIVTSLANPGYPLGNTPDRVEYHVFEDEADAVAALGIGDIDSILSPTGLSPNGLATLSTNPNIEVATSPANDIRYLGFNLQRKPMSDKAFRSALALLLDREALAETVSGGSAAYTFVNRSNSQWFDAAAADANARPYRGDLALRLESALVALREAGYDWAAEPTIAGDGSVVAGVGLSIHGQSPAPLTILTPGEAYDPSRPRYARSIAETLGWFGFDVRPVETDFDTVVDLAFTPGGDGLLHYDMYLLGWTLGNPALPGYYRQLFAPDGVMNNTGYSSAVFSDHLAAYESSFTFEEARSALWSMEATLSSDLPYLLLYTNDISEAFRSDRVSFGIGSSLGGLQGRLGGIGDVRPAG